MASAAATAPLVGTDELLLAAWPAEITTTFLPGAAGREVVSGIVLVPLRLASMRVLAVAR